MDVGDWLRILGLEQYAAAFRDNAIDASVLPSLTAEDLRDLGVTLVGHRRRLLDAIAALGEEALSAASVRQLPPPTIEAERRQLTVLFCDLVGSTELAARLDPEDLRAIIGAYHQAVAAVLTRFGGFVAKYMGELWFLAELNRHKGQLLLRLGHSGPAEEFYRKALSIAVEQGAKLWELRAAVTLARMWAQTGRRGEAHELLAPVYGWFSEGFDMRDLVEAKALLAELV